MYDVLSGKDIGESYHSDYEINVPLPPTFWRAFLWFEDLLRSADFTGISLRRHSAASTTYSFSDASGEMYGYARLNGAPKFSDGILDVAPDG